MRCRRRRTEVRIKYSSTRRAECVCIPWRHQVREQRSFRLPFADEFGMVKRGHVVTLETEATERRIAWLCLSVCQYCAGPDDERVHGDCRAVVVEVRVPCIQLIRRRRRCWPLRWCCTAQHATDRHRVGLSRALVWLLLSFVGMRGFLHAARSLTHRESSCRTERLDSRDAAALRRNQINFSFPCTAHGAACSQAWFSSCARRQWRHEWRAQGHAYRPISHAGGRGHWRRWCRRRRVVVDGDAAVRRRPRPMHGAGVAARALPRYQLKQCCNACGVYARLIASTS